MVLTTLSSTREKNQHLSQQTSLDPFQLSIILCIQASCFYVVSTVLTMCEVTHTLPE